MKMVRLLALIWLPCVLLHRSLVVTALKRPEAAAAYQHHFARPGRRWASIEAPNRPTKQKLLDLKLDLALSLRGGASQQETGLVASMRGFFDTCLSFLEKQSPGMAGMMRNILTSLESMTGMELFSKPAKTKTKKKKKKKGGTKTMKEKAADEDDEAESDTIRHSMSSKRKAAATEKKSSSSATKQKSGSKRKSQASAHIQKELKATSPNYRIQRELKAFVSDPPPNLKVKVGKNLRVWIVTMKGTGIYEGEVFRLRIAFPAQYPTVPPSVYFLPPNIPVHEHVYTNGDICLSLLGKDWRPTMTGQSIAVSIQSILSSAQSKSLPMDNARHAQNKPGEYQKDWVYHDDNC